MAIKYPIKIGWHYTTGQKFILIAETGFLKPTSIGIVPPEKPILWFSSHQYWEPSACKGMNKDGISSWLTMDETRIAGGGLVRFGVPLHKLDAWDKLKKKARVPLAIIYGLETIGIEKGAKPSQWYGTTKTIPLSQCVSIQVMQDSTWVEVGNNGIN